MLEALIVAVLIFFGLVAWAAVINFVVKMLFEFFDRRASMSAPLSGPRVAQIHMGNEQPGRSCLT